jgi:hypothetical protein
VPQADICAAANCSLFDQLVGAGEQGRRHFEAERPCGCKVDQEFHLDRKLDWQIGCFGAFQNPINEVSRTAEDFAQIGAIADETTLLALGNYRP